MQKYLTQVLINESIDWLCYRNIGLYEGDILSLLHTCVCQMHNLIEDDEVSALVDKATDKQKIYSSCGFLSPITQKLNFASQVVKTSIMFIKP